MGEHAHGWLTVALAACTVGCSATVVELGDRVSDDSVFSDVEGADDCAASTIEGALLIEQAHWAQEDQVAALYAEIATRCFAIETDLAGTTADPGDDIEAIERVCTAAASAIQANDMGLEVASTESMCSGLVEVTCDACDGVKACDDACSLHQTFRDLQCSVPSVTTMAAESSVTQTLDANLPSVLRVSAMSVAMSTLELELSTHAVDIIDLMQEDESNCAKMISPMSDLIGSFGEAGEQSSAVGFSASEVEAATR